MSEERISAPPDVPGRVGRALLGFVVRDGRYYWSGFAMWWRFALLYFVMKFAMRLVLVPAHWRDYPELWGIPGLNEPIAGSAAATAPIAGILVVLFSYRQRRRFNAAAPRGPVPAGDDVAGHPRGAEG